MGTLTLNASVGGIIAWLSPPPRLVRRCFNVRRRLRRDCLRVLEGISLLSVKRRMEFLWMVLLILSLGVIVYYTSSSRENMTNKDLLDTLKTFGEKGTPPSSKKTKDTHEEQIYGPKTSKIEPKPAPSKPGGDDGTNVYPDIYGPEITPTPGSKCGRDDDTCDFNTDFEKAFPREDNEPQPFLTDFSKFQH